MIRFAAALALLLLSVSTVHCQFGTKSLPAVSCKALLSRGAKPSSGVYWIKPRGVAEAFQGYCDMDTFGGGWLMCYTTNLHVHVSREINSTVPYASNGYRSDCRNFPFNHLMCVHLCLERAPCDCRVRMTLAIVGTWIILQRSANTIFIRLCGFNSMALAPSKPALLGTQAV